MTNDKVYNKKLYKERRQELRNNATPAEQLLWHYLKSEQLGVKFRRQHGIGDYIVDFYCPKLGMVIELDGSHHYEPNQIIYDNIRSDFLLSLGLTVIRYSNHDVLTQTDVVINDIIYHLKSLDISLLT